MTTRQKILFGGAATSAAILTVLLVAFVATMVNARGDEELSRDVARGLPGSWRVEYMKVTCYPGGVDAGVGVTTGREDELAKVFAEAEGTGLSLPDREAGRYPWIVTISDSYPVTVSRVYRYSHDGRMLERPANATRQSDDVADTVMQAIAKAELFR